MKTLAYPDWDTLELREAPDPVPMAGEVVVRVAAVGICGSEVEAVALRTPVRRPPRVMGHEFCGLVETVAPDVTTFKPGDRVVANSNVSCGSCVECRAGSSNLCPDRQVFGRERAGAFAERVAVPVSALLPLPERVSPVQGALVEPLANAVHAWGRLTRRFPETVVVLGCGAIGLLALQVARAAGAMRLVAVDTNDARLELAHAVGAEPLFNPRRDAVAAEVQAFTRGRGADVVLDCAGTVDARRTSVEAVRRGGEIVWLGLHDDDTEVSGHGMVRGERRLSGSYGVTAADMEAAIAFLAHGRIEIEPWVRPFGLDEGVGVFRALLSGPPAEYAKALLLP